MRAHDLEHLIRDSELARILLGDERVGVGFERREVVIMEESGERAGLHIGLYEPRESICEIGGVDKVFVAIEEDMMLVILESLKMIVLDNIPDNIEEVFRVFMLVLFLSEEHWGLKIIGARDIERPLGYSKIVARPSISILS